MIKVKIYNKQGTLNWSAKFETQELADAWKTKQIQINSWGKEQRVVRVYENGLSLEAQGENSLDVLNFVEGVDSFGSYLDYTLKAEYTVEQEDVSLQVTAEKKIINRKKKREFGEYIVDKIAAINDSKLLNTAQVDSFMENALISNLREHLYAGNINTFIDKLTTSDVSAFFTSEEKSFVIQECNNFLTSIEE